MIGELIDKEDFQASAFLDKFHSGSVDYPNDISSDDDSSAPEFDSLQEYGIGGYCPVFIG